MSSPTKTNGYEIMIKVRYMVWNMHKHTSVVKSNTADRSNKESVKLSKLEDLRKAGSQNQKSLQHTAMSEIRDNGKV